MTVVLVICTVMLGLAAVLLVIRIVKGPTMLDRAVALDALVAITIGTLVIEAAVNKHTTTLPILVALTLVGFVGSVSIARFTRGSAHPEGES
ncbi:MAG TPA: monovalent cation/H+ antiporter complex subunit F [Nocardioidaceae bacterium]